MTDFISRDGLLWSIYEQGEYEKGYADGKRDAVPVEHAEWIENDNGTWSCGRCHSWIPNEQHYYARYCIYCGAKMDGDEKEAVERWD